MNLSGITQTLETINIRPDEIHDARLSEAFHLLLQLIEDLSESNEKLKAENQKLRDEISLMKGEQPNLPGRSQTLTSLQKKKENPKTPQKIRNRKRKKTR